MTVHKDANLENVDSVPYMITKGSLVVWCLFFFYTTFAVNYSLYKQELSRMGKKGKREVEIELKVQCIWKCHSKYSLFPRIYCF